MKHHFTSSIMADIRRAVNNDQTAEAAVTDVMGNAAHGACQALVTIPRIGDGETRYRLILAPVGVEIAIAGLLADDHFGTELA